MSIGRNRWLAAGSPQHGIMQPVVDLAAILRGYGITIGTIGNRVHMMAPVAEDHTWYTETGWPGPGVLGWVYAEDVMPATGPNLPNNSQLMGQIVADRSAGVPGTEWIKYINWTDSNGDCWHEAWDPAHRRGSSGDRNHGHISGRTDYLHSNTVTVHGYDPVARWRAGGQHNGVVTPVIQPVTISPPFPGRIMRLVHPLMHGVDVHAGQQRLQDRHWSISVDGWYGPKTTDVVRRFQVDSTRHGWPLTADGELGPITWHALWARPES